MSNLDGKKVLLGVSGGVAAYKAVDLASKMRSAGAEVKTVMTESACELIGPKSFEAVTAGQVYTSLWTIEEYKIGHISLADWADIVVVAPATANIIGKTANGICDDLLSTVLCVCWEKPLIVAPAMNERMWNNPVVQQNIEQLKQMGADIIGPESGNLACGTTGIGRMTEPTDILERIKQKL
ncbi:MAG: flavoprotein [Phycisphaerae bacterium]|nr:flavoprotein [Phycisphaerae bacterium]